MCTDPFDRKTFATSTSLTLTLSQSILNVQKAFYRKAKTMHPDVNPDNPDAEGEFRALQAAYDVLKHEGTRKAYDGAGRATGVPRRRPKYWRKGSSAEEPQQARKQEPQYETVAQAKIRTLIEKKQLGEAVAAWVAVGSPLALAEFIVEQCRLTKQFPNEKDLPVFLDALHASDSYRPRDDGLQEDAVMTFVERKTSVYNALIRVSNECGHMDTVFTIIDEMEKRNIDKGTFLSQHILTTCILAVVY